MKKLAIGVVVLLLLVIAALLVIASQAGSLIRQGVVDYGPELTGTSVSLEEVNVSFLNGDAAIRALEIGNPSGFESPYAFRIGNVELSLDVKSVLSDTLHIRKILIDGAELNYELGRQGSNIQALQKNIENAVGSMGGSESSEQESSGGKDLIVDDIYINGAQVTAKTTLFGGKEESLVLADIHLQDIGTEQGGVPASVVVDRVMTAVTQLAKSSLEESLKSGQLKSLVEDKLGESVNLDDAKEKLEGLKGLFNR